ncbi:carboxymuconolactone decarboxylase family protein [Saccharopolyspora rectivirgula]|jgi:AhpD family alkylhydroperoxidase|uniref:Transposase n=1 Tax=Saccharopolyspora rectivirgula TaxID=28042 RepID=A0A073AXU7_9PSEU|nr:carboxymuconolactone decarboxylase family protein [Saccharopolyspora rectivirgula]KEI44215.1 transposase [Saccharopolyspora rectivirgula]
MPRIPAVPQQRANWITRLLYRFSRRRYTAVLEPMAVLAHHQPLLLTYCATEGMVQQAGKSLPEDLRELALYRVAVNIGCSWCVDFGEMQQRYSGLDTERLREIDRYATSEKFTELERKVIEYADAMTAQPMQVTDQQVAELDRQLGHKRTVELTFLIALENLRSRFNHAMGITAQGFADSCPVSQVH